MNSKHDLCPLGAGLQKYWNRLSPKEREMKLDAEALYSLCLQEPAGVVARMTSGNHVVDAFCGAGGNAIAFALAGKRVTAIDLNADRLEMARYNARVFGVDSKIEFVHGNSLELLSTLMPDALYFAPPWGGPEYAKARVFPLSGFSPDGNEIMRIGCRLGCRIVFQIPKNFDLGEFKQFDRSFLVHRDVLDGELLSYTAFFNETGSGLKS